MALLKHRMSWVSAGHEAGEVSRGWVSKSLMGSVAYLKVLEMKGRNGSLKNAFKTESNHFTLKINPVFLFLKELNFFFFFFFFLYTFWFSIPAHFNSKLGLSYAHILSGSVRVITWVSIQQSHELLETLASQPQLWTKVKSWAIT